jgi:hypothetical protein
LLEINIQLEFEIAVYHTIFPFQVLEFQIAKARTLEPVRRQYTEIKCLKIVGNIVSILTNKQQVCIIGITNQVT